MELGVFISCINFLLFFEYYYAMILGCSILLRGGNIDTLNEIKTIVMLAIRTIYNSRLKVSQ